MILSYIQIQIVYVPQRSFVVSKLILRNQPEIYITDPHKIVQQVVQFAYKNDINSARTREKLMSQIKSRSISSGVQILDQPPGQAIINNKLILY